MERNVLIRDKASLVTETIFSCFMLAFGRKPGGDQLAISPNVRIHEQAVLLAVILNVQASINGMVGGVGGEHSNALKQAELMRWLLGSTLVFQAVDKEYTEYICAALVPGRAVPNKSLRMIVPAKCEGETLPALDSTDPKNHQEVLARFVKSDMELRVRDGYAMFTALLGTYADLKTEVRRVIVGKKKPTAQTISLLYYLSHLPMVLSDYGAQPMVKTSAYIKEHAQLFALLHDFATLFWATGTVESCPQLRELMLEVGIALTIMTLKRNAGSYGRLTGDPACVPDPELTTRMSRFCIETEIPSMDGAGVWNFVCAYNQVHPTSSGRPNPGTRNFFHPYNKSTALHHWMLHVLMTNLCALADTTALDKAPTLFSYKIGRGTSNKMSLDDLCTILALLPSSEHDAIDDEQLMVLLQSTWTQAVIRERLRVLEHLSRVAVVRAPRFACGKNQYWATNKSITLLDLEEGIVSMGHMHCSTKAPVQQKNPRYTRLQLQNLITKISHISLPGKSRGPLTSTWLRCDIKIPIPNILLAVISLLFHYSFTVYGPSNHCPFFH